MIDALRELPRSGIGGDHRGPGAASRAGDGAHPGAGTEEDEDFSTWRRSASRSRRPWWRRRSESRAARGTPGSVRSLVARRAWLSILVFASRVRARSLAGSRSRSRPPKPPRPSMVTWPLPPVAVPKVVARREVTAQRRARAPIAVPAPAPAKACDRSVAMAHHPHRASGLRSGDIHRAWHGVAGPAPAARAMQRPRP